MKRSRFIEEQIASALKYVELGMVIGQMCREMDIGCDVLGQVRRAVARAVYPFQSVDGAPAGGVSSGLIMPEWGPGREDAYGDWESSSPRDRRAENALIGRLLAP
ncbi:hypothetical protein [Stenotrophomonas lactitubi]|uniref:hypothetical protein n=1 Tax=Stenotrophomonas lactitubi TaxID=2045214 RepID=UPI003207C4AC